MSYSTDTLDNLVKLIEACDTDQEIGPAVVVDVEDVTTFPTAVLAPHVKQCLYDDAGYLVGVIDATGVHLIDDQDNELGPIVIVDTADVATFPTDSGMYKKQCLIDGTGNMIGFVDADGVHLIVQKDELGPAVVVDVTDASTLPDAVMAPHEKQCLYDAEGNLVGVVDSTGSHLIIDDDNELGPVVVVDAANAETIPVDSGEWKKQCTVDADGNMNGFVDADGWHPIAGDAGDADDAFGVPRLASASEVGTNDFFGVAIPAGANVVEYPGNKIVCLPSNQLVDTFCRDGSKVTVKKDGTEVVSNSTLRRGQAFYNGTSIDASTPVGVLEGSDICNTITMPECGGWARVETTVGVGHSYGINRAKVIFQQQQSCDGGATWTALNITGGQDGYDAGATGNLGTGGEDTGSNGGENTFVNIGICNLAGGTQVVCTRQTITLNELEGDTAGADTAIVVYGRQSQEVLYSEEWCC